MNNIFEIERFLSFEECDRIIELGISVGLENAATTYKKDNFDTTEIDEDFNKRKISYIHDAELEKVKDITEKILLKINENPVFNNIHYTDIFSYSFNKYTEGDFLNWHEDKAEITFNDATLTIAIQLNEDYEGGGFYYIDGSEQKEFSKKTGTLIIFESTTQHKVDVVKSGMRYSLNCWPAHEKIKSFL